MSRCLAFIVLLAAAFAASHAEAGPIAVVYDYLGAVLSFDKVAGEDGVVTAVDGLGSSLSLSREDETASVIDPVTTAGDAGWDFELKLEITAGLGNGPAGWTDLDGIAQSICGLLEKAPGSALLPVQAPSPEVRVKSPPQINIQYGCLVCYGEWVVAIPMPKLVAYEPPKICRWCESEAWNKPETASIRRQQKIRNFAKKQCG